MDGLRPFLRADFDWVVHTSGIWENQPHHVPDLHDDVRGDLVEDLQRTVRPQSPLGRIVAGEGGSGKTHLLSMLRREAYSSGAAFVAVDMTDVRDFLALTLSSFVQSLMQPDDSGREQFRSYLIWLVDEVGAPKPGPQYVEEMANCHPSKLPKLMDALVRLVNRKYPGETLQHQDVLRSLVLLNCADLEKRSIGYTWLQGEEIEKEPRNEFGYTTSRSDAKDIITGLSWFLAWRSPILLAIDQIDPIIAQHNYIAKAEERRLDATEQMVSRGILTGIAGGLSALHGITRRTLVVLSSLQASLEGLTAYAPASFMDRFREPLFLMPMRDSGVAQAIVATRLAAAYEAAGFTPPYPTWPFKPEAFEEARALLPRELLQRCERHRLACRRAGAVSELASFDAAAPVKPPAVDDLAELDRAYETYKGEADVARLADPKNDDILGELLVTAARCLVVESPRDDAVDAVVDTNFPGGQSFKALHARIRLVYHDKEGLEKHYCLRALQHANAVAFQSRLTAALTSSGIDRRLQFRHLIVFRSTPVPSGAVTQQRLKTFREQGGILVVPSDDELRSLDALQRMQADRSEKFDAWLKARRPVSRLPMMKAARLSKGGDEPPSAAPAPVPQPSALKPSAAAETAPAPTPKPKPTPAKRAPMDGAVAFGVQIAANAPTDKAVTIPLRNLRQHTIVLAGAGSGKTVLVRRIVEEAALLGVPSIVIDAANDLARLGEPWPEAPAAWGPGDAEKAAAYIAQTETVVWTPGVERGNPLALAPLPDFAAVAGDEAELTEAVDMAREAMAPYVAQGKGAAAQNKLGVLNAALRRFALDGPSPSLDAFADWLGDLPPDAQGGISNGDKLGRQMADALRAQMQIDPMLRGGGAPLDPAVLFGLDGRSPRTRVSVVNIGMLASLTVQQQFVNQLAMTLFSWLKRNPVPADVPLQGLLVIDEAKDFVPSRESSLCTGSLKRLAAQARKYGLGLVFATQAPKDIEHTIVSNCFTHVYGSANSPAAIDAIKAQLQQRGGKGDDIGRLGRGRFYVHNQEVTPYPVKTATPLCLSHHPTAALTPEDVLVRAAESRRRLG